MRADLLGGFVSRCSLFLLVIGKKTTYQYVATAAHGVVGTPIDKVALTFKFTIDVTVSDESPKAELKVYSHVHSCQIDL